MLDKGRACPFTFLKLRVVTQVNSFGRKKVTAPTMAVVVTGGSRFGMTTARLKCFAVWGKTECMGAPSLRCRCQSSGAVMVRRWTTADADGTAAAEEWDLVELVPDGRCGVCGLFKTAGRGRRQGCEMRWAGGDVQAASDSLKPS